MVTKMKDTTRLLSLDPSSSCVGYAVFEPKMYREATQRHASRNSLLHRYLVEAGVVRSSRKPGKDGYYRLRQRIAPELREVFQEWEPDIVLIETADGRVNFARNAAPSTLIIYGVAVGFVTCMADYYCGQVDKDVDVHLITANEWTRKVPKKRRAQALMHRHPGLEQYAEKDRGLDMMDAIGLATWWMDRNPEVYGLQE